MRLYTNGRVKRLRLVKVWVRIPLASPTARAATLLYYSIFPLDLWLSLEKKWHTSPIGRDKRLKIVAVSVQIRCVLPVPLRGIMYGIICQTVICYSEVGFSRIFICYGISHNMWEWLSGRARDCVIMCLVQSHTQQF